MLLAMFIHTAFLNRTYHRVGAVIAGIGFGTFIDELGKFITSDNDYFFRPSIALIYITFIVVYFLVRLLYSRRPLTKVEALANVLSMMTDAVAGPLHADQKLRIVRMLGQADLSDPLAQCCRDRVGEIQPRARIDMGWYFRMRDAAFALFLNLVALRWFRYLLVAGLVGNNLFQILTVADIIIGLPGLTFEHGVKDTIVIGTAQTVSLLVASLLVVIGFMRLPSSRLDAYRWFQWSVLIQILITQVFVFYDSQLSAISQVFINLILYLALALMIRRQRELTASYALMAEQRPQITVDPATGN